MHHGHLLGALVVALSLAAVLTCNSLQQNEECTALETDLSNSYEDDMSLLQSVKEPMHLARSAPASARKPSLGPQVAEVSVRASDMAQKLPTDMIGPSGDSLGEATLQHSAAKLVNLSGVRLFQQLKDRYSVASKAEKQISVGLLMALLGILLVLVCFAWNASRLTQSGTSGARRTSEDRRYASHDRLLQVAQQSPANRLLTSVPLAVQTAQQQPLSDPKASSASSLFAHSPRVAGKIFVPSAPPSSNPSHTRYCIPLQELIDLSEGVDDSWFNVTGLGGEPIFHVEVSLKATGRVLEVSKVHSPTVTAAGVVSNAEVLATVMAAGGDAGASRSSGGRSDTTLPPQVLDVSLQDGRLQGSIESYGDGRYGVMKHGIKAFAITGEASRSQLSVVSAQSGHTAASIERRGVFFESLEYLELVVNRSACDEDVFFLASVLAVIAFYSWPTQSLAPEPRVAVAPSNASSQHPHLVNVAGVSANSLPSAHRGPAYVQPAPNAVFKAVTPSQPGNARDVYGTRLAQPSSAVRAPESRNSQSPFN